jgi:hypothetical protein
MAPKDALVRRLAAMGLFGIALLSPLATLSVAPGTLDIFVLDVSIAPITATVDVKPESFELRGTGVPVTVFVELLEPDDVRSIDVGSVRLCLGVDPCTDGVPPGDRPKVGDADRDGIDDLKLTFDRPAVGALVRDAGPVVHVVVTVSGLVGDRHFAGADLMRVVP